MLKVTLRGLLAHKFRLVLTVVAVVVSVSFMCGTQVLTATISTSFDKVFDDVYKNIETVVRSTNVVDTGGFGKIREPISADVIPTVEQVDGVTAVEGQVQGQLAILDKNGDPLGNANAGPPTFGLNWLTQPTLNGWVLKTGAAPTQPTDVVLDQVTADKGGYVVGDPVKIQVNKGVKEFTVVGTAGFGTTPNYAGSAAALFVTPTAQELLVQPGKFTWINVAGADGISQEELSRRVGAALPAGTEAITGKAFTAESQDVFRQFFSIIGGVLLAFGIIALFVGAFIIYNTFSIIITQRTRELALLRAMGAGRGQVLGSVTIEALIVGAVSSALGLLGGVLLATGMTKLLSATGGSVEVDTLTYPPVAFISSFVLGVLVTFLSSLLPAIRASRVPPVAAMRDVAVDRTGASKVRLVVGLLMGVAGMAMLYVGLYRVDDNALPIVGGGAALVFLGVTVLGPLFAKPLSRAIGAPLRGFNGRLARNNAMRNPRRTATTASALMIGVGLVVLFAILIQSFKSSFNSAIDQAFTVDLIVDSGSFGQTGIDQDLARQLADVQGVATATGIEVGFATIAGEPSQVLGADLGALQQAIKIDVAEGDLATLRPDQVAMGTTQARDKGWTVGTELPATFVQGGATTVTIGALYELSGGFGNSGALMSLEGFATHFPPQQQVFNQIFVKLEPGASGATVKAEMSKIVKAQFPTAKVQDLTEYKASQTGILDVFLFIITVMLVIAIFIAVLGIVNTLLLSVYERTREIGLLRAVGMGRRQVRSIIRWESVIFSLQGTIIGTAIGFGFAWAVVQAIAQTTSVTFSVPWGLLAGLLVMAMVAGVVAAVIPAFSASRLNVLDAIATD